MVNIDMIRHDFTYYFIIKPSNVEENYVEDWEGNVSTLKSIIVASHKKSDFKIM